MKERAARGSASLALGSHNVEAVVGNYYVGSGVGLVRIVSPTGSPAPNESHTNGRGNILASSSGGAYAATSGTREYFDFDVKFNRSSGPSGQVEILFTSGGLLHSSRWTGFSTLEQALAGGNLNIR